MTTSRNSKTIEIPEFMDSRGSLYVKEFRDLPFIPKRLYYIKDVPTLETRGAHAHRSCHQILIALQGSLDVELIDSNGNITYNFNLGSGNKLSSHSYSGGDTGGGNVNETFTYLTYNDLDIEYFPGH